MNSLSTGIAGELRYDPGIRVTPTANLSDDDLKRIATDLQSSSVDTAKGAAERLYTAVPIDRARNEIAALLEKRLDIDHSAFKLRCACIRALETWNRPESMQHVYVRLRDPFPVVREHAACAIVHAADVGGIPLLVQRLQTPEDIDQTGSFVRVTADRDRDVVKRCLIAIGPVARSSVERLKGDPNPAVQAAISEILASYGP